MRQSFGMRGQISSKSNTCTERMVVYAAGISAKVKTSYPGRPVDLPVPRGTRATGAARLRDGLTGVSRRHSRALDLPEGLNMIGRTAIFESPLIAKLIGA